MEAQIKIRCGIFLLMILLYLPVNAQIYNFSPIKIIKDIGNKNFRPNDTIRFSIQNLSKDTIYYQTDVMMLNNKEWVYSPYFTRYFNHDISYAKLKKILNSKLPVVFSMNYYHPANILKPNEITTISYEVSSTESRKKLIKLRLNILKDKYKEDMIFSNSFHFVQIK